jgi:hypothetical protein
MQKTEGRWDEAERYRGDSVDSAICAWGTHIRMGYSYAHDDLPCLCGCFMRTRRDYESRSVLRQDDNSRLKMAYIKGGKPRNETTE